MQCCNGKVLVSRREAWDGLVVPIEVPIRGLCRHCGGRGGTWSEPCADCHGTGTWLQHHSVRVTLPPGVADGARIRFRVSSPAPIRSASKFVLRSRIG